MAQELQDAPWAGTLPDAPWAAPAPETAPASPASDLPEPFLRRLATGISAGFDRTGELALSAADQAIEGVRQIGGGKPAEPIPPWLERATDAQPENAAGNARAWQVIRGLGNLAGSVIGAATSPMGFISAPLEEHGPLDTDGRPMFPKEVTEFGLGLIGPIGVKLGADALRYGRDAAQVYRFRNGGKQIIGNLPKDGDFKTAADALGSDAAEGNLHTLWQERGIHPAEALHDAQSDAVLRQEVAPPSFAAYHGSSRDFERFDSSKIGEGEGAQSYGHGLYFAEEPAVAKNYARRLANRTGGGMGFAGKLPPEKPGNLYRVRINADRESFLDWDKSFDEQSPYVQEAIKRVDPAYFERNEAEIRSGSIGQQFKRGLLARTYDPEVASKVYREAGIPGIKYLDQGSRAAGEGSRNYVLFNDSLVEITHKNGVPLTPTKIDHPQGTPVPENTPRSALAQTGDPLVDRVIRSAVTRRVIDNAVIDDRFDVPYSAGGSVPLEDPTVFIDRHFPRQMTVDGVTFDPADPFVIHENVEQHVMEMLTKAGMSDDHAYRVAHFEFAEKAEGAWYAAHGIDQARAEAAYMPFIDQIDHENPTNPPPNLYKKPYPHRNVRDAGAGPVEDKPPTEAMVARARAIMGKADEGGELRPAGADVTRPESLPTLAQQKPRPSGLIVAEARQAIDRTMGLARSVQEMLDPMSVGAPAAQVLAKDAISAVRRIRFEHAQWDAEIMRRFSAEQQERMWNALDEESVLLQEGKTSENMGLATLAEDERRFVEAVMDPSRAAWTHAVDVGLVEGDGLPAYTPRMAIGLGMGAKEAGPKALNELGRNVFTRTAQMLHRKHLMAEDTEAAMRALVQKRMEAAGASPAEIEKELAKVKIIRSIRTLPLATSRMQEAAIWKEMINKIEAFGKATGEDLVRVDDRPTGWFTIDGHPAFTKWMPRTEEADTEAYREAYKAKTGIDLTGRIPVRDQSGNIVFDPKPIYMHPDFRGPMNAIMDPAGTSAAQDVYGFLMAMKGKVMTTILNSPLIHNEVVWGKALEAVGGRQWLAIGLYFRGNRMIRANPQRAGELIDRGLNWVGPRAALQDISGMQEEVNLIAGRSITAKLIGAVPGLWSAEAETATRSAIDKLGDFWHNTLLWDRVRDLQFGLADHLSDRLVAEGADRITADRMAAHFSNLIVGSIPKEAMSAGARATANLLLFSRSFTLGNLAVFKQAAVGLPAPIRAQIARDMKASWAFVRNPETGEWGLPPAGEGIGANADEIAKWTRSAARWKAVSTIAASVGLYYIGNALYQHAFNILARDSSVPEEIAGYARRYSDLMADAKDNPFELRHLVGRLSPTYDNEPAKQDRVHIGYADDGTAIYGRNPVGKFGEELIGYPTMPMEMARRKLSPTLSSILDIMTNDQGFGRKVYDTSASDLDIAVQVGKHIVMRHLPASQIEGAADLLRGEGDPTLNKLQTFGPALGFTTSKGAPGTMEKGEYYAAKEQFETRMNLAWPDIKKQIQSGDIDGARDAMKALGAPQWMINFRIRAAQNPAAPIHGRTLRDFEQYATPEQRRRFEFQRDRQPSP